MRTSFGESCSDHGYRSAATRKDGGRPSVDMLRRLVAPVGQHRLVSVEGVEVGIIEGTGRAERMAGPARETQEVEKAELD